MYIYTCMFIAELPFPKMASTVNTPLLSSTNSYIWSTADILGKGATSTVYKGRHKKKASSLVACKVTANAWMLKDQLREMSTLQNLNHKNIVKFIGTETEHITQRNVLVMELCECSLLTILERPENVYGVPETEFVTIVGDVASGLQYLRSKNFIHRDIKPGNIMSVCNKYNRVTYKLADFGTARVLEENEEFTSFCGTEEYLNPDIFKAALLRQPNSGFTALADLWSVGATFYHAATGVLPWRPRGGRHDRPMMHKIVTNKTLAAISGVESSEGGVTYSDDLPTNCHISKGLRPHVVTMLRRLMALKHADVWTWDEFFSHVDDMVALVRRDVFDAHSCQFLKVYVPPNANLAEFQEAIVSQNSQLPQDQQVLYHDNKLFFPEASVLCKDFPATSETAPIVAVPCISHPHFPPAKLPSHVNFPPEQKNFELKRDYADCKLRLAQVLFRSCSFDLTLASQNILSKLPHMMNVIMKTQVKMLLHHFEKCKSDLGRIKADLQSIETGVNLDLVSWMTSGERMTIKSTSESVSENVSTNVSEIEAVSEKSVCANLTSVRDKVDKLRPKMWQLLDTCANLEPNLHSLKSDILDNNVLERSWVDIGEGSLSKLCTQEDMGNCAGRFQVHVSDIRKIYHHFLCDFKTARLEYNREQIHKQIKLDLFQICREVAELQTSHCEQALLLLHSRFIEWSIQHKACMQRVTGFDQKLVKLISDCTETGREMDKLNWTEPLNQFNRLMLTKLMHLEDKCRMQSASLTSLQTTQITGAKFPPHVVYVPRYVSVPASGDEVGGIKNENHSECLDLVQQSKDLLAKLTDEIQLAKKAVERCGEKMKGGENEIKSARNYEIEKENNEYKYAAAPECTRDMKDMYEVCFECNAKTAHDCLCDLYSGV